MSRMVDKAKETLNDFLHKKGTSGFACGAGKMYRAGGPLSMFLKRTRDTAISELIESGDIVMCHALFNGETGRPRAMYFSAVAYKKIVDENLARVING